MLGWKRREGNVDGSIEAAFTKKLMPRFRVRLARNQYGVMPLVTLSIILWQVILLHPCFQNLEAGIACQSAKTIGEETPAIDRKAVFRSARWGDNAAETTGLKDAGDFPYRLPKKLGVFERLAGNKDVSTLGSDFGP